MCFQCSFTLFQEVSLLFRVDFVTKGQMLESESRFACDLR